MKKNLIVVAIATAMVAPATVMAGATFYGHAQAELAQGEGEAAGSESTLQITDNARGRIGMKASEDLGNGWKGLAVFEYKADTADGNSTDKSTVATTPAVTLPDLALTARETMVGLKGPMGQFELGRVKQAYKYTGGVKYDAFVTTLLEARGFGGMSKEKGSAQFGHSSFHSNALAYRNKFGPINVNFTYGAETDDGSMTFSLMFKKGGIEAFVAMADQGDFRKPTTTQVYEAIKFGGKFKTGAHSIMLQLENITTNSGVAGAADVEPAYTFAAYQLKMGKNVFVVNVGAKDTDTAKDDVSYLALGVIHNMSKKTRVFAGYRSTTTDLENGDTAITVGLRKTFSGGS